MDVERKGAERGKAATQLVIQVLGKMKVSFTEAGNTEEVTGLETRVSVFWMTSTRGTNETFT